MFNFTFEGLFKDVWSQYEHVEANIDINFSVLFALALLINIGYYILDWYFKSNYPS